MPPAIGKRVLAFVRSVLPAERVHFLLLFGATFLFIAHGLRWWVSPQAIAQWPWVDSSSFDFPRWVNYVAIMALPMWAAGAAAGFVCLVRIQRPLRRLMFAVLLPAFATLLMIPIVGAIWFREEVGLVYQSVNDTGNRLPQAILTVLRSLGPGLQIAATGFILVAIFTAFFSMGRATQPIRLRFPFGGTAANLPAEEDRRTAIFVWMMICLVPLVNVLNLGLVFTVYRLSWKAQASNGALHFSVNHIIDALSLLPLVVLALGKDRRAALKGVVRSASPKYFAIAALIPIAIASALPLGLYFVEVNHSAVYGLGQYISPKLSDYIGAPSAALLWFLLPAFVEEIAWRGYLQPRLVRKYGLIRGIFFVGIVWGAFHFAFDFGASLTAAGVLIHIAQRLSETIAQSYVLGWLTIRSRSILPATVAHGIFNVTVVSAFSQQPVRTPLWIVIAAWAIVGYLLFRYFPAPAADEDIATDPSTNYEAAT
jgi:CAAX protease family protein